MELLTLDNIIVLVYLIGIVTYGFISSKGVTSICDFSISSERYGIFVLVATLSASFIGGGFSAGNASKVAQFGIGNIVALLGFSISIFAVGYWVAPRIKKFSSAITTGEIMGKAYGLPARVFTGIFGMLVCAGILGAQVSAIGYVFNVFLGLPSLVGIAIGCGIVIFYSTFGGMKAVVATDVVQFLVLGIGMPLVLFISVRSVGGVENVVTNIPDGYLNIFNGYSVVGFISLFMTLALGEALVPPYVQRLLMGKDLRTTSRAIILSSIISVPFFIITGLIGLVGIIYFAGTEIDTNSIMHTMIFTLCPIGIKGFMIAGVLSIVMSSADSFLNSASVGIVNDVIIPLHKKEYSKEKSLTLVRVTNLFIGILSTVVAVTIPNILDILLFSYSFWSPVILVPLAAALLGVRTIRAAFYSSMIAGCVVMIVWTYVLNNPWELDGTIAGFIANLVVFIVVTKLTPLQHTASHKSYRALSQE